MANLQPTSYSMVKIPENLLSKEEDKDANVTTFILHSIKSPSHSNETKRKKKIQIGNVVKLSQFADSMILYKSIRTNK